MVIAVQSYILKKGIQDVISNYLPCFSRGIEARIPIIGSPLGPGILDSF
jgi:hypothetical protein